MKSLALQPWKWFSWQWGLPSANQLCAAGKPLNIFGPLHCGERGQAAELYSASLSPYSPIFPSLSSFSLISFLNKFSGFIFILVVEESPTFNLSVWVIWLWCVPGRTDWVKLRLLTPPVPKHSHSQPLLTWGFLCQAGGAAGGGAKVRAVAWIAMFLCDVSSTINFLTRHMIPSLGQCWRPSAKVAK